MLNREEKITAELARWALAVDYTKIPSEIIERAKYQILGLLGAVFGSLRTNIGKRIVKYVEDTGKAGEIPIPGSESRFSLKDAVKVYSGLSMLLDYDDYLFMGHTGHSSVWIPLLGGLLTGKNGKEILTAVVIGNELGGRLGGAVLLGPHNGQMWSFIHGVNSALIMGRFLGLDFEQLLGSISFYLYQSHYPLYPGFMGSDAKIFTATRPILEGLDSVEFAKYGFYGPDRILEVEKGFLDNFSLMPLPFLISDLGKVWVTKTLAVKLYPGCAYIDTTIDALRNIFRETSPDPDKIKKVAIEANLLTYQMNKIAEEFFDATYLSPININFNLRINTALFLLTGRLAPEFLDEEFLMTNRRKIISLSERIDVEHSWEYTFDTFYHALSAMKWQKLLNSISLNSMKSIREELEKLHGSAGIELSVAELLRLRKILTGDKKKFLNKLILQGLKNRLSGNRKGDFTLSDIDFDKFSMPFGVKVVVEFEGGESEESEVLLPAGVSYMENFKENVIEKFRIEASAFLNEKRINEVIDIITKFEEHNSYTLLSALFD